MNTYGDVVTDEMQQASGKVTRLALKAFGSRREPALTQKRRCLPLRIAAAFVGMLPVNISLADYWCAVSVVREW